MNAGDLLFDFTVFYPVVTASLWMAGGILFRLLEERRSITRPAGAGPG